jgi:hypothetical protein
MFAVLTKLVIPASSARNPSVMPLLWFLISEECILPGSLAVEKTNFLKQSGRASAAFHSSRRPDYQPAKKKRETMNSDPH